MITEDEAIKDLIPDEVARKIVRGCHEYIGQIDHFYEAVGMVVVGQLFGYRVMRLVSSRRCWATASKIFGDLSNGQIMPEKGDCTHRSLGYSIVKEIGGYWEIISGKKSRDDISLKDRKMLN